MLAKLWKKVLLAVCIIACLFNITSKLVNRHSLKENLENANDGITVFNIFQKKEIEVTETDEVIDNVMSANYSEQTSETETDSMVVVENMPETQNSNETENASTENVEQDVVLEENTENAEQQENSEPTTFTYKNYLTNLFNF